MLHLDIWINNGGSVNTRNDVPAQINSDFMLAVEKVFCRLDRRILRVANFDISFDIVNLILSLVCHSRKSLYKNRIYFWDCNVINEMFFQKYENDH